MDDQEFRPSPGFLQ
ncbi:UNVERIFIED_CONTAM: hypothetical protein GTU68_002970 [Idotea baltica]|nr:hypothetical protein [Idotea baltica]